MTAWTGIAIAAAISATAAFQLGLVLEKQALGRLPPVDARHALALLRTLFAAPIWIAGFVLLLSGFGLQVVALTFAPVSVVQPILGSGVVVLLVLSRLMLRERLGRKQLTCVLVMAAAVIVIALSASGSAGRVGHQASGIWIAAVSGPACVLGVALGLTSVRSTTGRGGAPQSGVSYGLASGLLYGVATLGIKALSAVLANHYSWLETIAAVAVSPYAYLTVGCSAAGFMVFQTGLQRCRVAIVGPVSNVTGSVFFMISGTWLFGERLPADPVLLGLRVAGIVAAGMVVAVLSMQAPAVIGAGADSAEATGSQATGGSPSRLRDESTTGR
ncbi:MAG TPA: DMT family transporter [Streptosporangiaceae bacterium]|nr:DMT family transporter [Streptosporangiaceae bacterium]